MKHHITMAIGLLFWNFATQAQTCLPGGANFTAQSQVDNFSTANPGCTQIEGGMNILGAGIMNLNGLSMIQSVGGDLNITSTEALTSLTGLNNLTSIGGAIRIQSNLSLANIDGLENLAVARGDYFYISDNPLLTSISGLGSLDSIAGIFQIWSHDLLTSLSGLENLDYVGQNLAIFRNPVLADLDGLDNLTRVGAALRIEENDILTSLTSLEHPIDIQGALVITDNPELSDCNVEAVCAYLMAPATFVAFSGNASGCNSDVEIIADCISPASDVALASQVRIIPNPASDIVRVHLENVEIDAIQVRDALGRVVFNTPTGVNELNLADLASGVYFFEILAEDERVVKRVVKQ